jgi:diadenylate cyclase
LTDLLSNVLFLFERLNWLSLLDLFLVAMVFYTILMLVRDTQAVVLLRGVILLLILLTLLTSLVELPAFSWLIGTTLPALFLAIPVIFAPEIRRGLERLGRAGSGTLLRRQTTAAVQELQDMIHAVVTASVQLSVRRHGALIVLQRTDPLQDYARTGVRLNSDVTAELLLQIFYPNTPLHDGAVIITDNRIVAGACVMPLSASGILNRTPERQMGLRHRAALGTSEATDAIAVVVSEETGSISIAHGGRMIRRLDSERLENILIAFYRPAEITTQSLGWLSRVLKPSPNRRKESPAERKTPSRPDGKAAPVEQERRR